EEERWTPPSPRETTPKWLPFQAPEIPDTYPERDPNHERHGCACEGPQDEVLGEGSVFKLTRTNETFGSNQESEHFITADNDRHDHQQSFQIPNAAPPAELGRAREGPRATFGFARRDCTGLIEDAADNICTEPENGHDHGDYANDRRDLA